MGMKRRAGLGVAAVAVVASSVAPGVGGSAVAVGAPPAGSIAPEANVSHHGHVSLWGTGLGLRLHSRNRGPSNLDGVTVRVRVSVPLSGRQELPDACLRSGRQSLLCRTGPLRADGSPGRRLALELRLAGRPDEVVVRIDTVWNGGATDRDPADNTHEVPAPATGDEYVF